MATIQVVVDDALLERLDEELLGASRRRSALIRRAIERELRRLEKERLDEQDRIAYLAPETKDERSDHEASEGLGAEAWQDIPGIGQHGEPRRGTVVQFSLS